MAGLFFQAALIKAEKEPQKNLACGENNGFVVTRRGSAKRGSQTPWRQPAVQRICRVAGVCFCLKRGVKPVTKLRLKAKEAEAGAQEPSGLSSRVTLACRARWFGRTLLSESWVLIALQKSKTNFPAQASSCCGLLICGFVDQPVCLNCTYAASEASLLPPFELHAQRPESPVPCSGMSNRRLFSEA